MWVPDRSATERRIQAQTQAQLMMAHCLKPLHLFGQRVYPIYALGITSPGVRDGEIGNERWAPAPMGGML